MIPNSVTNMNAQLPSRARSYVTNAFVWYGISAVAFVAVYALAARSMSFALPPSELFAMSIARLILVFACAALGFALYDAGSLRLGAAAAIGFSAALAMHLHQTYWLLSASFERTDFVFHGSVNLPVVVPTAAILAGVGLMYRGDKPLPRHVIAAAAFGAILAAVAVQSLLARALSAASAGRVGAAFLIVCAALEIFVVAVAVYQFSVVRAKPTGFGAGIAAYLVISLASGVLVCVVGLEANAAVVLTLLLDLVAFGAIPFGFCADGLEAIGLTSLHTEAARDPARIDPVTGLFNRRAFDVMGESIFRDSTEDGRPVSAMMAELDGFRETIDKYGIVAGDAVMRQFAQILTAHTRTTDLVARFSGPEFVIVMPNAALAPAMRAAENVRAATRRAVFTEGRMALRMTVTIGAATAFPGEEGDFNKLVDRSGRNLRRALSEGGNCVMTDDIEQSDAKVRARPRTT